MEDKYFSKERETRELLTQIAKQDSQLHELEIKQTQMMKEK